jgi:hypothetical protein
MAAVQRAQEIRDLVAVLVPAPDGVSDGVVVARFGRGQDFGRDQDVLAVFENVTGGIESSPTEKRTSS